MIYERVIRKVGAYSQHEKSPSELIEKNPIVAEANGIPVKKPSGSATISPDITLGRPSNGNGTFDYGNFRKYMSQFLSDNQLSLKKKPSSGKVISSIIFGFILLVLAFLTAIYAAIQLGIIN